MFTVWFFKFFNALVAYGLYDDRFYCDVEDYIMRFFVLHMLTIFSVLVVMRPKVFA